jgi:aspartyl-tRNA(Asn)/glutamyl-tRNA(Gln) amidotransferase subunit A
LDVCQSAGASWCQPVGLQLIGRMFEEETMLRVADAYERATGWHQEAPAL